MKRIGRSTPVWVNSQSGAVACGNTLSEAIGEALYFAAPNDWKQVESLPRERRVVIHGNSVLPRNEVVRALASNVTSMGQIYIRAYGREHLYAVLYQDATKVIIG